MARNTHKSSETADFTRRLPADWTPPPAAPVVWAGPPVVSLDKSAPAPAAPWPPAVGPPRRSGVGVGALIGALIAVLVLALGAGAWFLLATSDDDATSTAQDDSAEPADGGPDAQDDSAAVDPGTPDAARPSTLPATPVVSPEEQAAEQLQAMRAMSLPALTLDGRYVAQVSSKSVGITDPLQVAANGSHTFYAVDIVAELAGLDARVAPDTLLVVDSGDFGKYSVDPSGQRFWIGLVDGGFSGAGDVRGWCAATFPELSGGQLENACAVRTLDPSHS